MRNAREEELIGEKRLKADAERSFVNVESRHRKRGKGRDWEGK